MSQQVVVAQADERPAYPIDSVDRALRILLAFEDAEEISVAEAAQLLGVARSTAFRLLSMLKFHGFVRHDPRTKAYVPGPAILRVGVAAVRQLDVRAAARPLIEAIAAEVDETAHLCVLQRGDAFFLDCVEGGKAIRAAARTGTSLPANCTAGGKALLAALEPSRLRALVAQVRFPQLTLRSITSLKALEVHLQQVRERGYAVNDGESEIGLRAIGVVIPGSRLTLSVPTAIAVAGPRERLDDARVEEIAAVIQRHLS
jgi:IclR family transcriptional regulator, acetate operon repressor